MARKSTVKPTLFALRLRRARLNARLGGKPVYQEDLARLLGVSHTTVNRWETGRQLPEPNQMIRVARVLGMDEDEVWLDTHHIPPDMLIFLTTTREGKTVVENIRRIMQKLQGTQKPTIRRGVPEDITLRDDHYRPSVWRRKKEKEKVS